MRVPGLVHRSLLFPQGRTSVARLQQLKTASLAMIQMSEAQAFLDRIRVACWLLIDPTLGYPTPTSVSSTSLKRLLISGSPAPELSRMIKTWTWNTLCPYLKIRGEKKASHLWSRTWTSSRETGAFSLRVHCPNSRIGRTLSPLVDQYWLV